MNNIEIADYIDNKDNWHNTRSCDDMWKYCQFTDHIKISRQHKDWAIFIKDKNAGFYFHDAFIVPLDLIERIHIELIKEKEK